MSTPVRIHFSSAFTDRPGEKKQIRSALEAASDERRGAAPAVPTWIVIHDDIEGRSTYVAHHTPSQLTLMAPTVDALCRRVDTEMNNDTRYGQPPFRLDGRPHTRPDHDPGASASEPPAND